MNMNESQNEISMMLKQYAEMLDIPVSYYLEAKKRYESVGDWLSKGDSTLSIYNPEIYPQGSFLLGTVIKPISNKDEYDIDLVCLLADLKKNDTSQSNLKSIVGERLKEYDDYKRLLDEEGRRCWTLDYANEFHIDILPAINDLEFQLKGNLYEDAILITDKKKIDQGDSKWPKSNPKGYAKWFFSRQEIVYMVIKKQIAKISEKSIDDVPDYKVKTPLQKVVQILKRHRDIFFLKKQEKYKPISIIITTLAAKIYQGQEDIYTTLSDILNGINEDIVKQDGKFNIPNPANTEENFADKWNEDKKLPLAFFDWINNARDTFCRNVLKERKDQIVGVLNESLGIKIMIAPELDQKDKLPKVENSTSPIIVKKPSKPWCF
jgi:hypothetical protein